MALRIACPNCKAVLKVEEQHAGRVMACGKCGSRFRVGGSLTATRDEIADDDSAEVDEREPVRAPARSLRSSGQPPIGSAPRPRNRSGRNRQETTSRPHWSLLVAGGASGSILVCALCWFLFLKPARQDHEVAKPVGEPLVASADAPPGASQRDLADAVSHPAVVTPKSNSASPPPHSPENAGDTNSNQKPAAASDHNEPISLATLGSGPPHDTSLLKATAKPDLSAVPLEELIERVGDGVVLIKVLDRAGNPTGLGSGFVIDEQGSVATCFHVMRHARRAVVQFRSGFSTEVAGSLQLSPQADLAILKLQKKPPHLTVLRLASDELRLGQEVIAIGHPSGLTFTPTRGMVNGVHKTSELPSDARHFLSLRNTSQDEQWVQTDTVISPGNSGGPLMNRRGEVVGVNSWVSTQTRFAFAVHARHLTDLMRHLPEHAQPLSAVAPKSANEEAAPAELDPKVETLYAEYQRAAEEFLIELDKLRGTTHTRAEIEQLFRKNPATRFANRFLTLGRQNRKTKTAFQSYFLTCYVLRGADPKTTTSVLDQTTELLLEDHLADRDLGKLALMMPSLPQTGTKSFLRAVAQRSPHHEVQAYACLALAKTLQSQADAKPDRSTIAAADKEIVAVLKRVTEEFADVQLDGHSLADMAKPLLFAKEHLAIGKKAPDIVGPDSEGVDFKLSDYHGKVVLLEFWGDWCPHCVRLYPYERVLVNKLKGRRFAMLGVNTDAPDRLDAVQKDKKVNWRSWSDGSTDGPIAKEWGIQTFPTMILIDHKGTIRLRGNLDPDMVEQELDSLLAEAEGRSAKTSARPKNARRALRR